MEAMREAMEDLAAAVRGLALSVGELKSSADESQYILWEIGAGKPHVDGAMEEVRSVINSNTGSPDGAVPANCSTLCFYSGTGGLEAVASSLQSSTASTAVPVHQELADSCDNATSSPDGVVPTQCSTLGPSPNIGGVDAGELPQQLGIVSVVSPGPVGALRLSTKQQFGILKPDKPTPTIYSAVVSDIAINAMRVRQDTKIVLASVMSTSAAAGALPATTPPHPSDYSGVLLARPPPWPEWMASDMHSGKHRCAWLLPMQGSVCVNAEEGLRPQLFDIVRHSNTDQNDIFWTLFKSGMNLVSLYVTSSLDVEVDCMCWLPGVHVEILGSGFVQLPWPPPQISTLWLSSMGQFSGMQMELKPWPLWKVVDILGRCQEDHTGWLLRGLCNLIGSHVVRLVMQWDPGEQLIMPWPNSCGCCQVNIVEWIWQQQINGVVMISSEPSPLPCDNSADVNSIYKHKYAYAQLDSIYTRTEEPSSCIHYKLQAGTEMFDILVAWLGEMDQHASKHKGSTPVAIRGGSIGNLVRLYRTLPWDPGVGNELSTEVWQSELGKQHICGRVLIYSAHCCCTYALYQDHFGKHHGAQQQGIVYISRASIVWRIAHHLSYLVLDVWALANQLSEVQATCPTMLVKFVARPTSTIEALLLLDGSAVISPSQIRFILVHIQQFLMGNWIQAPSAIRCFCLPPGAVEERTKLQKMQPNGAQSALLLHLLMQLQQKFRGWVFLRRMLLMTKQSFHCTCDLWYTVSSPLTMPWDPGLEFREKALGINLFQPVLGDLSTSLATWEEEAQLHAHFPRAPAWGQAVIEEGGNVTTWPTPTKHPVGHNASSPLNSRATPSTRAWMITVF